MAIKKVLRLGDPLLSRISESVEDPGSDIIKILVDDIYDTMRDYQGVGLAAPQIGVLKRVVVFGFTENSRYPDSEPVPETVLINPVIDILTTETIEDWEGCLSIPGMRGLVPRATKIRYAGFDCEGKTIDRTVEGFHARVVLHECDHLDGILYVQRLKNLADFGFIDELQESKRYSPAPCDS